MFNYFANKSFKREISVALLVFLCWMGYIDPSVREAMVLPSFLFIGASFGMAWASKQTDLVTKPKRGSDAEDSFRAG